MSRSDVLAIVGKPKFTKTVAIGRDTNAEIWVSPTMPRNRRRRDVSLAGRMEVLTLWPLSQGELRNRRERFIDAVFTDKPLRIGKQAPLELGRLIAAGGYPEAVARKDADRRAVERIGLVRISRPYCKTISA